MLFIIFAPQESPDVGPTYSSYAVGAGGTRALYDVLGKVGFTTERNDKPLTSPPDTTGTYVLISPAQPLTAVEQTELLKAVRLGAILVFTMGDDNAFADSLDFELTSPSNGFYTMGSTAVAGGNPPATDEDPGTLLQMTFPITATVASKHHDDNQTFLWLQPEKGNRAAQLDSARQAALIIGHRVGRGYALAIAPASITMNRTQYDPRVAIAIVRGIQFATVALGPQHRSDKVVFDEYHHGFGTHADIVAAIQHAMVATPLGRVTLEMIAAALILLLAYGVRPLAPIAALPVSRRSPLEHVGALAYAYSQVDARTLGTDRLVRGLRRRHSLGIPRSLPDFDYLSALRTRLPVTTADVDNIITALEPEPISSSGGIADIGRAVANIERAFQE